MKNSSKIRKKLCAPHFFPGKYPALSFNALFLKAFKTCIIPVLIICIALVFTLAFSGCDAIKGTISSGQDLRNEQPNDKSLAENEGAKKPEIEETGEPAEETVDEGDAVEPDYIDPSASTINVYYSDSSNEFLVGEARTVEGENKLIDAFYELMKDPTDSSLYVLVPPTTRINSINVYDGVAKVDLSSHFLDDRFTSDTVDILLKYAVVNTMTEFREVNSVLFYIDGSKLDILGQLDVKEPIFRRNDLIKN